ncbi:MAG TPA: hypothetical protein VF188_07660 [Longimicrobiales bacterium]
MKETTTIREAAQRVLDGLRHYTDPDDVTREWYEIDDLAAVDALRQALALLIGELRHAAARALSARPADRSESDE